MSRLPPDSYTARRLEHATPEHLHLTTRRTFIGPIPEGWLNSHRKSWYKSYVRDGKGRAPTFTAAHPIASSNDATQRGSGPALALPEEDPRPSSQSGDTRDTQTQTGTGVATTSTTSLLRSQRASAVSDASPVRNTERSVSISRAAEPSEPSQHDGAAPRRPTDFLRLDKSASKLQIPKVRFSEATKLQLRNRALRLAERGGIARSKLKPGELMKMEKMLVRIDTTQQTIREDFDERISQGVETKTLDKWREFMVACRKHAQGAVLQLYQTRVIANTPDKTKKKPKAEIIVSPNRANVNMFSSLDKTLCIWTMDKKETYIYYLRPQSGASSVEWYTFLNQVVGRGRARTLQVNVPDLSVSLRLDDPFKTLESSKLLAEAAEGDDDALAKAVSDEKGAAGAIVARCIGMLKETPEWADVLRAWAQYDRIGLAWKRYDRLEWVHGAVEQRMYGTIAMQKTHDLELRPKDHYPQDAKTKKGNTIDEPAPVEGFLIRLTSQRGQARRMGRMLYKRLYFTSQNHYLVFVGPARASPPPPPKMPMQKNGNVPSTKQLVEATPLTYDVEPYPLDGDYISWLDTEGIKSTSELLAHDKEAAQEADRNTSMLMGCDGFINMSDIKRVRKFHKGATPVDDNIDSGSDVDFDEQAPDRPTAQDGRTGEVDEDRTFELLLNNGLVIRLQAYNKEAKQEWIKRLRKLVKYWHHRAKDDMTLFKSVREQNLRALQIDERAEAQVGSFAYKWEVSQSFASPTMYNLCGTSNCRTIHMSGVLFRKPRRHTTFTRYHVILSAGTLLIFQDTVRKRSGAKVVHIHHERIGSMDLKGCYLYSGLLTEKELLYQNQTFDSNTPGHHALPRIYLDDAWTSTDEDAMTTFVLWHAKSKSWFRSSHFVDDVRTAERQNSINAEGEVDDGKRGRTKTKLTRVSQLGATGRSVVFKARSRAERDHWVLALQVEIERLAVPEEEVRLVDAGEEKK